MTATATAASVKAASGRRLRRDVMLILGYTSWAGAAQRSRVQREDRLTLELIASERVPRLLVSNPFRSIPAKLLRGMVRSDADPFPASETRRLHEPLRLRRTDPKSLAAIRRSCAAYEASARRAASKMRLNRPAVITTHPLIAGFGSFEWAGPVTYHATDDLTAYPPLMPWATAFEAAFAEMRAADRRTVAVSSAAQQRVGTGAGAVIPNGVEPAEWLAPGPAPQWFLALPRPRFLYVGALDGRIDAEAVRAIAAAWPRGSVALVGPHTGAAGIRQLEKPPNVTVRPRVDRSEFPGLVAAADVGLIPHVRTPQTEAMSPLKLYEYLAAGVPVAATDLPGTAGVCPGRTVLAQDPRDFVPAVARALQFGPWPEDRRRAFIFENAWRQRFAQLLDVALADEPLAVLSVREGPPGHPGEP